MLQYCFWFMFWFFDPKACGILAPQSRIEPAPSALGGKVLTTASPGKSLFYSTTLDIPGSNGKESACSAGVSGDAGLIPRSGKSPGEGNGYPLQCSCLKNSTDRGAWQATDQLKELDMTEQLTHRSLINIHAYVIPPKTLSNFSDYTCSADGD